MDLKFPILVLALALLPFAAAASTKDITCTQTTDKGVAQMIYVKVDGTLDNAEVESFAVTADCAKDRSCGTNVYKKDVLPSVIRLTNVTRVGALSYATTIDINRSTLAVVTHTVLSTSVGTSKTVAHGKCTVKSVATHNVL